MKDKDRPSPKEHYQKMRVLSCEQLWSGEVPKFDQASPQKRIEQVGLIRAIGVVFSESGTPVQKETVRQWLQKLLQDPAEKVRRYAMVALPKIGAAEKEETELLSLLQKTSSDREKKFLAQTLEKIGGRATLEVANEDRHGSLHRTAQKVEANLARAENPGTILFEKALSDFEGIRIHLRGRSGLEQIIRDEVEENTAHGGKFRVLQSAKALVAIAPTRAFSLSDLYTFRCFSSASIVLGAVKSGDEANTVDQLAKVIASAPSQRLFESLTDGPIRYRLEFSTRGHQRSIVRQLTNRVYALSPRLLNDSRNAPWEINIFQTQSGLSVELSPRLRPDPRFAYRRRDIPAASHPPLAACMARLAGRQDGDIVWDPFCGSGLELIESTLLGSVQHLFGTDRSEEAILIAQENLRSAWKTSLQTTFTCCDFRDFEDVTGLGPNTVSLIITNPPMGRRVPVADLRALIEDLFSVAATVLRPGGRLVFANPLPVKPAGHLLHLDFRQKVDLGGFHCHVEKYSKTALKDSAHNQRNPRTDRSH
jgi:23S rRNA G2445 N2-methylase RlmL